MTDLDVHLAAVVRSWLAVGMAVAAFTMSVFRFRAGFDRKSKKADEAAGAPPPAIAPVTVSPVFGGATALRQFLGATGLATRHLLKDKVFIAIALIAGINTFMNSWYVDTLYGVTTWPVTYEDAGSAKKSTTFATSAYVPNRLTARRATS